jgi:hypothetical protein
VCHIQKQTHINETHIYDMQLYACVGGGGTKAIVGRNEHERTYVRVALHLEKKVHRFEFGQYRLRKRGGGGGGEGGGVGGGERIKN